MVGCIPEVLTLLLTPILTYLHMVYVRAPYMSYITFLTSMTSGILHAYICQYGCQKKHQDLKNAANHLKYPTQIFVWPKIEISYFLIFSLYFSEFPLYILGGLSTIGIQKPIFYFFAFSYFTMPKEQGVFFKSAHVENYEPPQYNKHTFSISRLEHLSSGSVLAVPK